MIDGWDPQLLYDVYANEDAVHDPLKAGKGMLGASATFTDIFNFVAARRVHASFASLSLILCSIQLVKNLDFHPRMGLITRTIAHAAAPMLFFFTLFFAVVVVYR